jgi:glycosyltransferase involved in cell wall biosynthesis
MRVLWLTSWYPNALNPFNGDFIQRHARAASLYNTVDVIHIEPDSQGKIRSTSVTRIKKDQLTETIVLLRLKKGKQHVAFNQFTYLHAFNKQIKTYVEKYGVPDIIHVHVPVKAGLIGMYMKRKYGLPLVVTEHAGIYQQGYNSILNKPLWFKRLTRLVFKTCDTFLPVSAHSGNGVNRLVTKKPFTIVPNTVDTRLFYFKPSSTNSRFRFIHVSSMIETKNPEAIIHAFKKFSLEFTHAELVLIGRDDDKLQSLKESLHFKPDQLIIKGETAYENIALEMQAANAFVLFSRMENSPCVILEALCCGLPVISSNVGGINELIDNSNGVLTDYYSVPDLYIAMKNVYRNYNLYNRRSIAEKAVAKYSYEAVGSQISDAYKKLKTNIRTQNPALSD